LCFIDSNGIDGIGSIGECFLISILKIVVKDTEGVLKGMFGHYFADVVDHSHKYFRLRNTQLVFLKLL
jgi:hypothetical protein